MDNKKWRAPLEGKIDGTWNIHDAIRDRDEELDFFLMLSSLSGSLVIDSTPCFLKILLTIARELLLKVIIAPVIAFLTALRPTGAQRACPQWL
jgi:hypothetical protein